MKRPPSTRLAAALFMVLLALPSCGDTNGNLVTNNVNNSANASNNDGRDIERVRQYIRSDEYTRLAVEVDYVPGLEPSTESTTSLISGLEALLDKPGGVEVVLDEELTPRGDDHAWTDAAMRELEQETFNLSVPDDTIKMHALFVDGHDARDDEETHVLGASWNNRNVIIYKQQLGVACDADPDTTLQRRGLLERVCQRTELAIWTHEIGHVLGLVSYGLQMVEDHEDPDHEHHDHNDECIMYWAYDRSQAFDQVKKRLLDDEEADPLGFDEPCHADIAAVRDAD